MRVSVLLLFQFVTEFTVTLIKMLETLKCKSVLVNLKVPLYFFKCDLFGEVVEGRATLPLSHSETEVGESLSFVICNLIECETEWGRYNC